MLLSAVGVLLAVGGNWRLLPGKYGPEAEMWTATRSYSYGMAENWVHNYVPCRSNCPWEATLPNPDFLSSVPFRKPFSLQSDKEVSSLASQLACVPSSFGYSPSKGAQVFPPANLTHCKDREQTEPRPKMWFDSEKEEFSMECPRGRIGKYVIHPKEVQLTEELKLEQLQGLWRVEMYPGVPVKYTHGEFVYGSCGAQFTEAILFPRLRPEVYTRAKESMNQRSRGQPIRPLIVLFLTVDSFSRRHFYRKMPKTVDFLSQLNGKSDYSVFDFKLHNIVGKYSPQNMVPMFTNKSLPFSDKPKVEEQTGPFSLWALAKDLGYVTQVSFESCGSNFSNMIGVRLTVDHHVSTFFCAADTYIKSQFPSNQLERNCIGPHWGHSHLLNYTYSLARLYEGLNQFHYLHLEAAHEASGLLAGTLDADLAEFLERFIGNLGGKSDLVVIVQGDHGMRYGNWKQDIEADQELKLPVLFLAAHTEMLLRIPGSFDSLWHNTLRLVSKRDFRATLLDLFSFPYKTAYPVHEETYLSNAYILHREKIPDWRTCENASIDPWYCSCLAPPEEIPPFLLHSNGAGDLERLVTEIAEETVLLLNEQVTTSATLPPGLLCHTLHFHYVQKAYGYSLSRQLEQIKVQFAIQELTSALIEVTAMVSSPSTHSQYSSLPYTYQGYPVLIRIITFARKDAYAGHCEDVSRAIGFNAEFCICRDLEEFQTNWPGLYSHF